MLSFPYKEQVCHVQAYVKMLIIAHLLALCILMDSSFWFDTCKIQLKWSVVYYAWVTGYNFHIIYFFSLKIVLFLILHTV